MNSTNLLLSSTGFLLLVALLFSFTKMNQGKNENPAEIASLKREIERLEDERLKTQNQRGPSNLIFTTSPYGSSTARAVEEESADEKIAQIESQLRGQIDILAQENGSLRDNLANANRPAPEPVAPEVVEVVIEEPAEPDEYAARRARLITNALLQATVQGWDPEFWTIAIDPAARANFNVGDELALRRNDGILCTFTVTSQMGEQFIGDLKSNLAAGAPEIVPGDELIIPPAFDRQLD